MKTVSLSLRNPFATVSFIGKIPLFIFAVLFCFNAYLYAGIKPVYKKGHVNRVEGRGNKTGGDMISTDQNSFSTELKKPGVLAVPTISYSGPQTYTAGTAITPLMPTSTGVAAPGYSNAPVAIGAGFVTPSGVAVDLAGNVYVADAGDNAVKEIPVGSNTPVTIGSGFSSPIDVAVDAAGNVYVADVGNNAIKKIPAGGGTPVILGSGFSGPQGVAVDASSNVYVADGGNNAVKKIPAGGGAPVTLASGLNIPTGVAVDATGNVYVAEYGSSSVIEIFAAGGTPVAIGSGFNEPTGVAVDASGNVYVADYSNNAVEQVPVGGGDPVTLGTGFSHPFGIAADGAGNVYIGDRGNNAVKQIKPVGGYYISPFLPGLSFNNTTGVISGTPTIGIQATNFTITAYNLSGSSTAALSIKVNVPLPAISYGSPQTYTAGTTIAPLNPTSNGVDAAGYSNSAVILGSGFNSPTGVAVDNAGNVYVADRGNNAIKKIPAGGGAPVTLGSGFSAPYGVAVDAMGNVYVADSGHGAVKKIPIAGGAPVTLASGFGYPAAVAVDASGNVYVADAPNNVVKEIPVGGGALISIGSGFSAPYGVSVDAGGNVYVANFDNNEVTMIPAGNGSPVILGSGFNEPGSVSVDAVGNVFVADYGNNAVKEIPVGGGVPVTLSSGFEAPAGIAADVSGKVYVADKGSSSVKQITPVGGYYISAALPAGLSFAGASGIISGTPTAGSPATNYTVTAYNVSGAGSATVSITVNLPLPTISYSSPQTYNAGTAITALAPASAWVTVPGYSGNPVALGSGFNKPAGVAVDASGNVYAGDLGNNAVKEIPAGGGAPNTLATGFNHPFGVAVDAAGNVYVADELNNAVKEILVGSDATVSLGSGFLSPIGVAVDASGNIYVADYGNNAVKEIPIGGGAPVSLGSGFSNPSGVAVDAAGNIYVGDYGNNAVKKIPAGGGAPVVIGSGFNSPYGVSVDGAGNVYVADLGNNAVKKIPVGGSTPVAIGSGYNDPISVAVDAAGNIYVADYGNNAVKKIKPVGGYYISAALPAGLSFDGSAGIISGTPALMVSPATNYTITAYNSTGSSQAAVSIKVNVPLPAISYTGPQTYITGTAIRALAPVTNAVAAPGYNSTPGSLGAGFSGPTGVAVDAAGNVYVADEGNNEVKKIPAAGGTPIVLGFGFNEPYGVAVDAAGNVYVADYGNSLVKEIPVGGGAPFVLGTGFSGPTSIAVDAAGNVYVADYNNSAVKKIPAGGITPVILGSGFNHPSGVAIDASGDVYVADQGNNEIKEIPVGGGAPVVLGSGFNTPTGVTVDATGSVFVADFGNNAVKKIPFGGGSPIILGSGFNSPYGVATDGAGNVYVADKGNNAVKKIGPIGGYYIGPFLPAGLSFNNSTGIISGTPAAVIEATNYTVTAYNISGSGTATVSLTVDIPGAPTLSYSSPQKYVIATAITALAPISAGVAAPGYSSSPVMLGSGFNDPGGVAVDAAGNIYVADDGNNAIKKIPIGGGAPCIIGSGFSKPTGIAVDAAGNVYVADYGNNAVKEIPLGGGAPVTLGAGFMAPDGVAVDASGNVYVTNGGNNAVYKIPAGGGTPVNLGTYDTGPAGVATDAAGNVYVAYTNSGAVEKLPVGGGAPVSLGSGFDEPDGVAVDAAGNVYVTEEGDNLVVKVPADGSAPFAVGSGFNPAGIAVDAKGNVYVDDYFNNVVKEIKPVGGYYLSNFLPAGLSFDGTAGIISGTPAVISPATNYTVTAYNASGGSSATMNIKVVSNNANLSALKISSGTLAPAFASGTTSYTANVANATTSITVTPTTSDPAATIKVNGTSVSSGTASAGIPLSVGQNAIITVVTAQDGTTTQTYTVTVTRAPSANANLSTLGQSNGPLSPSFSTNTISYTISAGNATASMTLKPVSTDPTATIKVNGTAVSSGTMTAPIPLAEGAQTVITTVVTAQDGTTIKTYTVTVTRAPSTNASLSAFNISNGTLNPAFAPGTTSYTAGVGNGVVSMKVTPTAADPTATITVNGTAVTSGSASQSLPLVVGPNNITTKVTAQDGTTKKTYTVTVTRAPSTNASLSAFKISNGTLSPVFATGTTSYTAGVGNGIVSMTATPTAADPNATITVNGTAVTSGTASGPIALNVGPNAINTVVKAQDGATIKTYTVTVTRAPSTNASLSAFKISNGTLSPAFATGTTSYTASVGNGLASMTITPTAADPNATITVNGTAVTSGSASQSLPLVVGPNAINTVVTAQNGVTIKTYTLVVTKAKSTNDNLLSLKPSSGSISPTFSATTTAYTESVANTVSTITITPTTAVNTSTVTVNGAAVTSGTASGSIILAVGPNMINTVVTAQDGTTTKTYTVTVTRATGGADSYDPGISVTKPTETPTIADDGILVHQAVSPNGDGINDFLQIDNISQYPDNKLMIMNRNGQLIFEAKGYDNSSKVFDGHSNKNGQMQLPGTYFYQLDYAVKGITKHKTGFLVLKY